MTHGRSPPAVILAAGRGSRMRRRDPGVRLRPDQERAADRGLKMLVPVAGRPFLAHVLDELAEAGFTEVCLVVGPGEDDPVRRAAGALAGERLRVGVAVQPEPRGSADAVLAAEAAVGGRPFVVLNADNLYPSSVLEALRVLDGQGLAGFERRALVRGSNFSSDRVADFAILDEADGWLTGLTEKPDRRTVAARPEARVSMTCWRFDPSIFDACRAVTPSRRGELELTDAVARSIAGGARFRVVPAQAGVLDLSRRADIPEVERRLAARRDRS